jgi:hypothetical protein
MTGISHHAQPRYFFEGTEYKIDPCLGYSLLAFSTKDLKV